jgi:hypothetical protein
VLLASKSPPLFMECIQLSYKLCILTLSWSLPKTKTIWA